MNSMIVEVNEDCREFKIITGINATPDTLYDVKESLGGLYNHDVPRPVAVVLDAEVECIMIEEASPLTVTVGGDADGRLVVALYNMEGLDALTLAYTLNYLTNYQA